MAESTLSLTYNDLRKEVGDFCSFDRDISAWDELQNDKVESFVQRGYRQYLAPPPLPQERQPHTWSFLRPSTTIGVFTDITGTLTSDPTGGTTITDTAADYRPDDANTGAELVGQTITITNSAGTEITRTISSVTDDNNLEVTASVDAGDSVASGDSYSIALDGDFNLPDAFGGFAAEQLQYNSTTGYPPIEVTGQNQIRSYRMNNRLVQKDRPMWASVRPRDTGGATAGQRFELMLWPRPDAAYTLHYRYVVLPSKLSATNPYPLGGALHGETVMASCLAIAEEWAETPSTEYRTLFLQRLAASVGMDRMSMRGRILGYNGDNSGKYFDPRDTLKVVTFNSVQYP